MHHGRVLEIERLFRNRGSRILRHVCALFLSAAAGTASAQSYPDKPIRLIIPFAAGNTGELVSRVMTPVLEGRLGQRILIEARPGASGNIGTQEVGRAAPNGYTLLMGATSVFISNQLLYKSMATDPLTFLDPVTMIVEAPVIFVVRPDIPVSNLKELQAYAKANPGKLNYSSSGRGTDPHILGATFASLAGVDIVHIPYKGAAEATMALRTKEVQMATWSLGAIQGQLRSGDAKPIAVIGSKRMDALPNVPTTAESGFAELRGGTFWGMAAPKGTDARIIDRLVSDIRVALADPAVAKRFVELGMFPGGQPPAEFAARMRAETARLKQTLQKLNIEPE